MALFLSVFEDADAASEEAPCLMEGSEFRAEGLLTLRVHVPNNWVLGFWVIVIIVQALGKYMIIRYLDP